MAKRKWLKGVLKTMHGVKVDLCGLDRQPCTPICQKEKKVVCKCHFSCNGPSTMCNECHMNNVR